MRLSLYVLLFWVLLGGIGLAHRVNVFAYVENGQVVVECSYSKSKRVNQGQIEVQDANSNEVLLRSETDEQGQFRFPIPAKVLEQKHDLRILLQAGEGHQNDWTVPASELSAPSIPAAAPAMVITAVAPSAPAAGSTKAESLTQADVERIVNTALDAKLVPIKRTLLEQVEAGPGLREIIGGIGWIFGLVGVAAYFKSRSRV